MQALIPEAERHVSVEPQPTFPTADETEAELIADIYEYGDDIPLIGPIRSGISQIEPQSVDRRAKGTPLAG